MSRSFKHTPYSGDKKCKFIKRIASKRFRSKLLRMGIDDEIPPSMYKRFFESWNICDFWDITTLRQWLKKRRNPHKWGISFFDEKKEIRRWYKWYKWK